MRITRALSSGMESDTSQACILAQRSSVVVVYSFFAIFVRTVIMM